MSRALWGNRDTSMAALKDTITDRYIILVTDKLDLELQSLHVFNFELRLASKNQISFQDDIFLNRFKTDKDM
jgi:hypothetical protein